MSTKDFADKLIENLRAAAYRVGYVEATGSPFANRNQIDAELAQAIRDLREVLAVPPPHSEDFLTPRDEFAKAAMQGELASQHENAFWRKADELAKRCFLVADAMMNARQASSTPEGAA